MNTRTTKTAQSSEKKITTIVLISFFLIVSILITATACTEHKVNQTYSITQ